MENSGSKWRIWDMHVHSPQSFGGDFKTFIENVGKSKADVIGINDYCSVAGYEQVIKLGGISGKIIFPVAEFRMHTLLSTRKNPNGVKINFHIIFNNDPSLFSRISTWMSSLKCYNEKGENVLLGSVSDVTKISFDYDKVIESLKEMNLYESHALIWLPYNEYGGIDEIDPISDPYFKLSLVNKAHILGSSTKNEIDFFSWRNARFTKAQYESWFDRPKPCIKGSDAHKIDYPFGCLMNQHSEPIDKFCWINADMTFQGLKHVIVEPDRICIAEEPDLLKRVKLNPTKFIESIEVKKIEGTQVDDVWFDIFQLPLNSGLVAIIGNKGGGKSAITDILGLCGNTHQDPSNFSFLTPNKFRKLKPYNLSDRFEATIKWKEGSKISKKLSENPDKAFPERVKYIPQNFLERLCANIESDDFEKELKHIIYSHTPNDKRLGKASLDELINYKSSLINSEINQIQSRIAAINSEIVSLEAKNTEEFKRGIENQLALKKNELEAHDKIEPIKPNVGEESEESKKLVARLTQLRTNIEKLEGEVAALRNNKNTLSIRKEELNRAIQFYSNLDEQLKKNAKVSNAHFQTLARNNIQLSEVFSYKVDVSKLIKVVVQIDKDSLAIEEDLNPLKEGGKMFDLNKLTNELKNGQDELDKPAKEQQKYLDENKIWETRKKTLIGEQGIEGTIKFYEAQLAYINDKLRQDLELNYTDRKELLVSLFSKKVSLINIRKELFQPVMQFIDEFKELKERYDVKIDVSLELRSFSDNFFSYINQNRIGSFSGKEEGTKRLTDIIDKIDLSSSEGFLQLIDEILDNLTHDKRSPDNSEVELHTQLRKGIETNQLYNFIFSAEFLQPIYNLKLGNKTLQELSPGERGALLLIFYLLLDNDDIPLIIDQPEENLDNESVYHILVHFIKKVKNKRQIVIVTHNPNLAIVCDADQVVHMQIEKENKNTVSCHSGAIEDEFINKSIVDILEGTFPAFNNRDQKYLR